MIIQATSLADTIAAGQAFRLSFSNYPALSTRAIPIRSEALVLQPALMDLPGISSVMITRNDHSKGGLGIALYDTSGIDTSSEVYVDLLITFLPSEDGVSASD
ncbi:unnamed protein product [Albugo candida]|uniref:Uncharacterized protein n=1 Tax=Albugo candida TaxID=65357 RepID=A0A024FXC4_9STRA|nr:unnamed protein product [Albugo candida]|eukprot:CCI11775.1 unnamed protein product [Albugo candida]